MSFQGYTCAVCGSFVPNGQAHYCGPRGVIPHDAAMWAAANALTRIAELLDRVAKALEARQS